MAQKLYEESNIQAIADAIREKNGESTTYKTSEMAAAISAITTGGGGGIEVEPVVLSGKQDYGCSGSLAGIYINLFKDTISTKDLTSIMYMFYNNSVVENIPFEINMASNAGSMDSVFQNCSKLKHIPNIDCKHTSSVNMSYLFTNCNELTALPYLYNAYPNGISSMFSNCHKLRNIPEDYFDTWNFNKINTGAYNSVSNMFYNCYSLRAISPKILSYFCNETVNKSSYYCFYYSSFGYCYVLDELIDMPVAIGITATTNMFNSTFSSCCRIKNLIFATQEDGTPYTVNWKNQSINLGSGVYFGYTQGQMYTKILDYNSGITKDKEVYDDATYQALKNDPDWYANGIKYSRYNHDSAVATINSLPDTSAYLATAGGTNTIIFMGQSGELTDGGAINTLTPEEIAVATAKGWTVTIS